MNTKEQNQFIPFSPPDISDLEVKYVTEVLKSGWITTGPKTKLLEKKISEWIFECENEVPNCVCLNSATAALELSLRTLGIGPQEGGRASDEVITCAYTYTASASVISHVGAKTVLVDCSLKDGSLEMDYDALEKAVTGNTKAIIAVDIAGIPCNYEKIFEIVERKKSLFSPDSDFQRKLGRVAVIADAAHAFGAKYKNKMVGTAADFTCYSFHAVKNFTTAEGGAVVWNTVLGIDNRDVYNQFQLYSLHGQNKDALSKSQFGAWEYDIVGTWYKCNMTDIMAAIGLGQFERYPELLSRRKEIIKKYDAVLKPLGIEVLNHYTEDYSGSGHLYITRVPGINRETANCVINEMSKKGIATNVHYKPLPMHTAYKKLGFDIKNYPNAFKKFENEITLPLHTRLTDEQVDYIAEIYSNTVKQFA